MKNIGKIFAHLPLILLLVTAAVLPCHALAPGQGAAVFTLSDMSGKKHDLGAMKSNPMTIVYFFDAQSRPSQEGLLYLDGLAKKYKDSRLTVWGITSSPKDKVADFLAKTRPSFPILIDNGKVSGLYNAQAVLPTVCIIGPGLQILDVFQGGGKTMNVMMVRLAERKLQQKDTRLALAISSDAEKKNPGNVKAKSMNGYALLKAGRLSEAEKVFGQLSKGKGEAEIVGKEGLAAVYARQGKSEKALSLAREVEKMAPGRAYPHVVMADIYYSQNKKKEAKGEYETAAKKGEGESFQKAVAYNKLGRLYASVKDYKKSRELYDNAVALDPYYVEAMSNKGVTYEKEGDWSKALAAYKKGQSAAGDDAYTNVLAARAAEMLEYQKDAGRRERVDKLVKELAERFRAKGGAKAYKGEDAWTSQPLVVTFVDFQENGGLSERDGISAVLTSQLAEQLNASGRVKVSERIIIDRLLEELNIGSSELANPETSLRLGKVLAAKVIGTGTMYNLPESTLLNMRLINTETTEIEKVITMQMQAGAPDQKDLFALNRQVLSSLIKAHPLQAFVVEADGSQAVINIGSSRGVVTGTRFDVVEPGREIEYKGRTLKSSPTVIGTIEVTKSDPDMAYCSIVHQKRKLVRDDKVIEKIEEAKE